MIYTQESSHMTENTLQGVLQDAIQTKSRQKHSKRREIDSVQISCSAPGLVSTTRPSRLPQVSPPPLFAPCSRQLAVAMHLSRTPPSERIERGKEREKFMREGDEDKRMVGDNRENHI